MYGGELTPYVLNRHSGPCQGQNMLTWSLIQRALCIFRMLFARMDVRLFFPFKLKWSGSTVHTIVQGHGNHSVFPLGPMVTDIHKEHHFTGKDAVMPNWVWCIAAADCVGVCGVFCFGLTGKHAVMFWIHHISPLTKEIQVTQKSTGRVVLYSLTLRVPTCGLQIMLQWKLQLSNASNLCTKIKSKYWYIYWWYGIIVLWENTSLHVAHIVQGKLNTMW